MSGLDLRQVRDYIVRPALQQIGLHSLAAEQLVLATGLVESGYRYVDQIDKAGKPGPAYGLFQMERATHDDIHAHYLRHRPPLAAKLRALTILTQDGCTQMHGNHFYAAAMCRVFYLRVRSELPKADDLPAMARYWKQHYNTHLGAGRVEDFLSKAAPAMAL
jgi:hypothetical protein